MYISHMAYFRHFSRELPGLKVNPMVCRLVTLNQWWGLSLCHPFWRLYYNLDPGLAVDFESHRVPLPPGKLAAIPPMSPCTGQATGDARQLYIHFTASPPFDRVEPDVYILPSHTGVRQALKALMSGPERSEETAYRDTAAVLGLCLHALQHVPADRLKPQPQSRRVQQAIRLMRNSPDRVLTNPELAAELGMNTNAFINLFGRETGTPPQRWYLQMRLRRAGLLLAHSEYSIDEVADETGFADRNHLSKVFRRYHQIPPAAYRRNVRRSG